MTGWYPRVLLECCNILLPSYTKPLMWWYSYEWPQRITWKPFLQKGAPRNLSEIKFMANPRSLLDVMEWLVGIQECLECHNILLPSYTKPLMWWYSYEWPQPITWQPFFTRRCAQESVCGIKFLANPRSLLDIIEWLVGIQECLECCNILLPSYTKPLMWWWSYEWPQPTTWKPYFTRSCDQESV